MVDQDRSKQRVNTLRATITDTQADHNLDPHDRDVLIQFDEELSRDRKANNRCGWYHHASLLTDAYLHATEHPGALHTSLQPGDAGKRALETLTTWIHDQDFSDYTVQDKLSALRVVAATVLGGEDHLPEHYQQIEPGSHVDEDPAPLPGNIVEYADLLDMLEVTSCPRDRALFATEWAGGMRPKTLWLLQYNQVEFHDDHALITLPKRGKSDRRTIILVVGSQLLKQWVLEEHPVHDDPEAELGPDTYIWTHQDRNTHLAYGSLQQRFYAAGDRADITIDHSPQHFRRSAASVLAGQPHITERDLRQRFAWAPTSSAPEHYIAAHAPDTRINVARSRGANVEGLEERPDTAPVVCPRCGEWTTRGLPQCIWCPQSLDSEQATFTGPEQAAMQNPAAAGERSLADLILSKDVTADDLRVLQRLEPQIKSEPNLFEDLDELIARADAIADVDPDGSEGYAMNPLGLVGWLSARASAVGRRWARAKHAALRIHPGFAHYPPRGTRLAGLLAGWVLVLTAAGGTIASTGLLEELAAGEPEAVGALVVALTVGAWLVHRDIPSVEDAVAAAVDESPE